MKAADIMTRTVITVTPSTTVVEAIRLLTDHAIASLPVVEDGEVIGIVSEPDLLKGRIPHDPTATLSRHRDGPDPGRTVDDVMNEPLLCLPSSADAAEIAEILLANHVRAVPIIDGADLVGIVSRRDLLRSAVREDPAVAVDVRNLLDDYASGQAARLAWLVEVDQGIVTISGRFTDDGERTTLAVLAHSVLGVVRVHTIPA